MKEAKLKGSKERQEYEVEVRALISEVNFDNLLMRLCHLFGKPKISEIKTFLFKNQNSYHRIRIIKNSHHGVLTQKIGNYNDKLSTG